MEKAIETLVNSNGFWLFVGILVGTIIEILVSYVRGRLQIKNDIKNFKFELKMNINKINKWIGFVEKWRKDLSTDTVHNFNEYFDFSKTIFIVANNLSTNGDLYTILDEKEIEKLQENISFLSLSYESIVNNKVREQINEANSSKSYVFNQYNTGYSIKPYETVKSEIVIHINYLLKQLEDAKQNFEDILEHIENK